MDSGNARYEKLSEIYSNIVLHAASISEKSLQPAEKPLPGFLLYVKESPNLAENTQFYQMLNTN